MQQQEFCEVSEIIKQAYECESLQNRNKLLKQASETLNKNEKQRQENQGLLESVRGKKSD